MLSGAKHLRYLLENKQMQILRCAQDDSRGGFFVQPALPRSHLPICLPAYLPTCPISRRRS